MSIINDVFGKTILVTYLSKQISILYDSEIKIDDIGEWDRFEIEDPLHAGKYKYLKDIGWEEIRIQIEKGDKEKEVEVNYLAKLK